MPMAQERTWRMRRDRRESYMSAALRVEGEFNLGAMAFEPEVMEHVETFPAVERGLLRRAENR